MILNALYDYYQRLVDDPSAEIAPFGFSVQPIGFRVVIEPDGKLHAVEIMGYDDKGKPKPVPMTVPGQTKPPGQGLNPRFLWDNAAYLLGMVPVQKAKGKTGKELAKEQDRAKAAFEKLRDEHLAREKQIDDPAYSSVCRFLEKWDASQAEGRDDLLEAPNHNGIFQIRGQAGYVQDRPKVLDHWRTTLDAPAEEAKDAPMIGQCLVTGKEQVPIARLHEPKIKGIVGGQSVGGSLVSFNDKAYESFGYSQSNNAPVSEEAAFRYCTALNSLLAQRNRRVIIGDATTVFWTDKPTPIESYWGPMLSGYAEDEKTLGEARDLLQRIANGTAPQNELGEPDTRFYVLGLSPNAARISVRYWFTNSLGQLLDRIRQHMQDIDIVGLDSDLPPPTINKLLDEIVPAKNGLPDRDKLPNRIAGEYVRAILGNTRYPETVWMNLLNRIRIEGFIDPDKHERRNWRLGRALRAGLLKACLNRHLRSTKQEDKMVDIALDKLHPEPAYHCGRLMAVLSFAQEQALGKVNASVVRRHLSAVVAAPAAHLGRLLVRAEVGHFHKLEEEHAMYLRDELKLIGNEITNGYPNSLNAVGQSYFILGFYHEMMMLDRQNFSKAHRIRTNRGEWVRSKGESKVANIMLKLGVSYYYEPRVLLKAGEERIPDFYIPSATESQKRYIEYLGMNTPEYNARWESKIESYSEYGITEAGGPHGKLFVIDEREQYFDQATIVAKLSEFLSGATSETDATIESEIQN